MGKAFSKEDVDVQKVMKDMASHEWKLRRALWLEDIPSSWSSAPPAVLLEPNPDEKETQEKEKKDVTIGKGGVPMLTFKTGGGIVDNQAAKFASMGIKTGHWIRLKRTIGDVHKDCVGQVITFSPKGLASTRFDPAFNVGLSAPQRIDVHYGAVAEKCDKEPKKVKTSKVEVELPTGFGWVLTDKDELAEQAIVQSALYKLLLSCSTGPKQILCVRSDPQRGGAPSVVASCDIKAGTVCFVPYHHNLVKEKPEGQCAKVVLSIKVDERLTDEKVYWCSAVDEVIGNPNQVFDVIFTIPFSWNICISVKHARANKNPPNWALFHKHASSRGYANNWP